MFLGFLVRFCGFLVIFSLVFVELGAFARGELPVSGVGWQANHLRSNIICDKVTTSFKNKKGFLEKPFYFCTIYTASLEGYEN